MKVPSKVDALFIGGGGASYPGAFELAKAGQSILMVDEKGNLGGDCLYAGCIPSKAVRTKILDYTSTTNRVDPEEVWRAAIELKEWVQDIRYEQHMEEIKEHEPNLAFIKGWATIEGPNRVHISTEEGGFEVETRNLVVGAGAEHVMLNIPGKELSITSDEFFAYRKAMRKPPRSLAIIGGGYIGIEVADMLSRIGVHVTMVEMMDRVLPNMPPDLSKAALQRMQEAGVEVHLGFAAAGIEKRGEHKVLKAKSKDGKELEVEAEEVLMAVGRRPRTKGYGLEALQAQGLELEKGAIKVTTGMKTNMPNVYATGDVTGKAMLFHAAVKESVVAAKNILTGGREVYRFNYHSVPYTVFTYPEIAFVGYAEEELQAIGVPYEVVFYKLAGDAQSQIKGHREGWMKILLERESLRILGFQAYAHDAADLSAIFAVAIENNLTAKNLAWVPGPHPLTFEAINYAMRPYF
ncbi:MAG: dihydrolipoyl dehydrogenase [Acidilobus sp.]